MKNESWVSSRSFQRGSVCLRIARARSMPTDLPPISPVPIIRFQMSSTSAERQILPAQRQHAFVARDDHAQQSVGEVCSASLGRPLVGRMPSEDSSAWRNVRSISQPQAHRFQPCPGIEVSISAMVELSVTGRNHRRPTRAACALWASSGAAPWWDGCKPLLVAIYVEQDLRRFGDRAVAWKRVAVAQSGK